MKLYVCWGTFQTIRPGGHPCHNAYEALREAGHDPELERVYGLGLGPDLIQRMTPGRRDVIEELTGRRTVPVLITDQGEVIADSKRIVAWARENRK